MCPGDVDKTCCSRFLENDSEMFVFSYLFKILTVVQNSACSGHLLTTFANGVDPDQARQNIGSDLDPKCLTL